MTNDLTKKIKEGVNYWAIFILLYGEFALYLWGIKESKEIERQRIIREQYENKVFGPYGLADCNPRDGTISFDERKAVYDSLGAKYHISFDPLSEADLQRYINSKTATEEER